MTEDSFEMWKERTLFIPYNRDIGISFVALTELGCVMRLPHRPELVGDRESGALHVGAVAALVDATLGYAVLRRVGNGPSFATLNLRIDHLHPSTAGRELFCAADCYQLTPYFAYVRGSVYHDDPVHPIATSVAIFMITDNPSIWKNA